MVLKNVVFDVGNVLVRWSPHHIAKKAFPNHPNPSDIRMAFFKSPLWIELNLGQITLTEAKLKYQEWLDFTAQEIDHLMEVVFESLIPLAGSFELLEDLHKANIPLYCITDNVREIVSFLQQKYGFFSKFKGVIVSADVGILKPAPRIYEQLVEQYNLVLSECVFIDDMAVNVEGARRLGMKAVQFSTAEECRRCLKILGFSML